jgi:hypothetical protein
MPAEEGEQFASRHGRYWRGRNLWLRRGSKNFSSGAIKSSEEKHGALRAKRRRDRRGEATELQRRRKWLVELVREGRLHSRESGEGGLAG